MNEKTVRRWIASGRLSAVHEDGAFRITAVDLEPFAAGRRTPATVIVDRDAAAPRPIADTGAVKAAAPPPHEAAHLAELVKQLHRENVELAGRCGFLQARVQDLERENRLLRAPAFAAHIPLDTWLDRVREYASTGDWDTPPDGLGLVRV